MADFQQNVVRTFTRLADENLRRMEKNILRAARRAPIGVIIPALFNDLSSPAMEHIIQELAGMNFVKRIYISLAHSSEEEFRRGTEIIQPIKDRGVLLWNDAPAVQSVLEILSGSRPRREERQLSHNSLIAYRRTWLKIIAWAEAEGLVLETFPVKRVGEFYEEAIRDRSASHHLQVG
jgi:hypothetical protein